MNLGNENVIIRKLTFIGILIFSSVFCRAQENTGSVDDLEALLDAETAEITDFTTATFKSTRILNGHSIERMQTGNLDFRISHRFGSLNSGAYELFGLDQSITHFSLEYGITDWMMLGIGRGNYQKAFNGFLKYSVLRQSKGKKNMPISLSLLSSIEINTLENNNLEENFNSRLTYTHQLLIARKFTDRFSFQLAPTYIHRNTVADSNFDNDIFAVGAGGRFKISNWVSVNAEYYYVINPDDFKSQDRCNVLSLGFDIETGGHVFQIVFSNSQFMTEKAFIAETSGNWGDGDIHFGFNISRVFDF
ncbi:MAG: DUF5777 family beta-barrel protein [Candidatus Kapabacteria bacterium]|nr:DUF5777 family beta-barrel protein [Candidatus Kapabacteria bacterium]